MNSAINMNNDPSDEKHGLTPEEIKTKNQFQMKDLE